MRFGKRRNINEDYEDENKVLLIIRDAQINISKFCEEYDITNNEQLLNYRRELLEFIEQVYHELIDSLQDDPYGGAEGPGLDTTYQENSIDYEPEFLYLQYDHFNPEEIILQDCRIKAYVKFRQYLNYLGILGMNLDHLGDISDDIIDNNGVNVHQIISDKYDEIQQEVLKRRADSIDQEGLINPTRDTNCETLVARIKNMSKPVMKYIDKDYELRIQFAKDSGNFRYELSCSVYDIYENNVVGVPTYFIALNKTHRYVPIEGEMLSHLKKMYPRTKESKIKNFKIRSCKNPFMKDEELIQSSRHRTKDTSECECFELNQYKFEAPYEIQEAESTYQVLMKKFMQL